MSHASRSDTPERASLAPRSPLSVSPASSPAHPCQNGDRTPPNPASAETECCCVCLERLLAAAPADQLPVPFPTCRRHRMHLGCLVRYRAQAAGPSDLLCPLCRHGRCPDCAPAAWSGTDAALRSLCQLHGVPFPERTAGESTVRAAIRDYALRTFTSNDAPEPRPPPGVTLLCCHRVAAVNGAAGVEFVPHPDREMQWAPIYNLQYGLCLICSIQPRCDAMYRDAGSELPQERLFGAASDAATSLRVKGFCVLQQWVSACLVEQAQAVASREDFCLPNQIVADGLLGTDFGLVELPVVEESSTQLATLSQLSKQLYDLSDSITHRMVTACGFCQQVSAILFRQGAPGVTGEVSALLEVDASRWLDIFRRHRFLSMVYLGPEPGILDLWMLEESDQSVEEAELAAPRPLRIGIELSPGDAVVLRPELLARKLRAPVGSLAMMSLVLGRKTSARRVWPGQGHAPAAKALDEWIRHRLLQLSQEDCIDHEVPFAWRKDLQRSFDNGTMVAVRSAAGCFPRADTVDDWCRTSITAAADYATEVPFRRWDHSEVYDPDDSSLNKVKSACRHAAFLDGVELFTSHAFKMPEQDVRRCDPYQRLCAEAASSALHSGSLKRHGQRSGGLFVGCPSPANWEHEGDGGQAQALLAGRLSATLGLRGPSESLVHLEGAAGLAAASLAATALEAKLDFALALGVHLSLSPRFWLCCCRAKAASLSRRGRSLAFDTSCDGFVRGEACCALMLCRFHLPEPSQMESPPAGCITGSAMAASGCSTSLAPQGAAEIRRTVAEALSDLEDGFVDIAEVDGLGPSAETMELAALQASHRGYCADASPLQLTSLKASCGHQVQCAGLACVMQILAAIRLGTATAQPHLRQLSPSATMAGPSLSVECGQLTEPNLYAGILGRGGGTTVYTVLWGFGGPMAKDGPAHLKPDLVSWPGPATEAKRQVEGQVPSAYPPLEERAEQARGSSAGPEYCLIGSWDNWTRCRAMARWDADSWRGELHLGGEESFQILKDGDPEQAIFPNCRNARFGRFHVVQGPAPNPHRLAWLVGEDGGSSDFEVSLSFKGRRPRVTRRQVWWHARELHRASGSFGQLRCLVENGYLSSERGLPWCSGGVDEDPAAVGEPRWLSTPTLAMICGCLA
eukprot:s46_g40.t3